MSITNTTSDDSSDITEIAVTNTEEITVDDAETAAVVSAAGTDAALLDGDLGDPALHVIASAGQEPPPDPELLSRQLNRLVASVVAVEELSRQAREVAATDLGLYEGMLASRQQFEASLGEAQRLRVQAEQVLERAFGQQARATAEPLVAEARQVEQAFAEHGTHAPSRNSRCSPALSRATDGRAWTTTCWTPRSCCAGRSSRVAGGPQELPPLVRTATGTSG